MTRVLLTLVALFELGATKGDVERCKQACADAAAKCVSSCKAELKRQGRAAQGAQCPSFCDTARTSCEKQQCGR